MLNPDGGVWGLAAQSMEVARLGPNSLSPVANTVLLVAALMGAAWSFYKIARKIDRYAEYLDGQMKPNGGSSFRDAVDRTDLRVAELSDKFDDLAHRVERVDRKMDTHIAEVRESGEPG